MSANYRDINIPVLATIGAITTVLVVVVMVATDAWFRYEANIEFSGKVMDAPNPVDAARETQLKALDEAPVPIEEAMQQTIAHYAQRESAQP